MKVDRRYFNLAAISTLWASIAAALSLPAAAYLFTPPRSAAKKQDEWTEAGDVSRLPLNMPEEVVFRRNRVDGWKVVSEKHTAWVIRKSDTEIVAFAPQCTHLGCAYHWVESSKEFLCPCHSSTFSMDGKVLTGPAPRPLDRYDIKVAANKLLVGGIRRSDSGGERA